MFTLALKSTSYAVVASSLIGFFSIFLENRIELRTVLEMEYGFEDQKKEGKEVAK